jgi:hypothetical protein
VDSTSGSVVSYERKRQKTSTWIFTAIKPQISQKLIHIVPTHWHPLLLSRCFLI